jgi:hypothetical protein
MALAEVEVGGGKSVNFQAYIFDIGKYLRHGRYESYAWWWFGESSKFYDPAAIHVHFENAQPKKSQVEIQQQQNDQDEEAETTENVNVASKGPDN